MPIIPNNENFLSLCVNANKEYQILRDYPPKKDLYIIDWRVKYELLANFNYPVHLTLGPEFILFRSNYNNSSEYFYQLMEKNESENLDERVSVFFATQEQGPAWLFPFVDALAPLEDKKYELALWNQALIKESYNYGAFFIEGIPDKKFFSRNVKECKIPFKIMVVENDGFVKVSANSDEGVDINHNIKGVLMVNNEGPSNFIIDALVPGNTFIINRVTNEV
jgi:hypothetical protein